MNRLTPEVKFCRVFGPAIFLLLCSTMGCCMPEVQTKVFGDSSMMSCKQPKPFSNITWFKDGQQIKETLRKKPGDTLYIFCLETSDSGLYECRDNNQFVKSFTLTVENPENRAYFHIYNENKKRCVSNFANELYLLKCVLDDCQQKWSWTDGQKLASANDETKCLSVQRSSIKEKVFLETCTSRKAIQKWECKGSDLLSIEKTGLYFNFHGNSYHNFELSSSTGNGSRWVKYLSRHNICSETYVTVTPAYLVMSTDQSDKIVCTGINFVNPSYKWLKNGQPVKVSSPSVHANLGDLFLPFAYQKSAGTYTCVVTDATSIAEATAIVEVFEDPSVIYHSLNKTVNLGQDFCISCQMYIARNASYEVRWNYSDTRIPRENSKFNITITEKNEFNKFWTHLCMRLVQFVDRGKYSCELNLLNQFESVSSTGELKVYVKPNVRITKVGERLLCNASGFPPPRIMWYKDNENVEDQNGQNSITIENPGRNYTCSASNAAGIKSVSYFAVPVARQKDKLSLGIIIGCALGGVLLALLVIFLMCFFCRKKKTTVNNNDDTVYHTVRYTSAPGEYAAVTPVERPTRPRIEFQPRSKSDPGEMNFSLKTKMYHSMKPRAKTEWEVPPDCLSFDKKLGEGQFGQVWKGHVLARKGSRPVAIKMLRENSPLKDRKALIDELEFMKTMTPHPNIVGLVGCCTRSENVMIIVEYVPNGNLKDFLLSSRGQSRDTYTNLAPYSTNLTSNDLMSFAYQIARGMSYLEKIKCVHRDLAARNILVGDEKTCKIADFGLARDIYSENYYRKTNGGRLPLRWMAYESVFNGMTTSQSDTWSFGILLWEIVTLGGNPYPDMNRDQLIDALQRGYRMPKPPHCTDEVYSVMWECWQQNPDKRPTFAELTASFLRLMSIQQIFINVGNFGDEDYENVGSYEVEGE